MNVAVMGYRKTIPDSPEMLEAKAEHKRLSDALEALEQKKRFEEKRIVRIEKRLCPGTQEDIDRSKRTVAELALQVEEADYALKSSLYQRYLRGELTREQINSGELPPYEPPVTRKDNFGPYPANWIKASCKRWERGAKIRYYFRDAAIMLNQAGLPFTFDEKGAITSVNGQKVSDLHAIFFDVVEGRFDMPKEADCGFVLERLIQSFEKAGPRM